MNNLEVIFAVRDSPDGGHEGRALGQAIFIEAESIEELRENVRGAVQAHFPPDAAPAIIRLHFIHDEVLVAGEASTRPDKSVQPPKHLSKEGKKLALDYFNHVETQVALAAQTAYLVLVADTLLIALFVGISKGSQSTILGLFIMSVLLVASGLAFALQAATPHIRRTGHLFYVRTIADLEMEEYCQMFRDHDGGKTLHDELLKSLWGKSRWLKTMFYRTRWAIGLTLLGTVVMFFAFVLDEKASAGPRPLPPSYHSLPFH